MKNNNPFNTLAYKTFALAYGTVVCGAMKVDAIKKTLTK